MLQKQTVAPRTFSLLKELMNLEPLSSFNLVGGTGLSLKIGHRISVDLDLFSNEPNKNEEILHFLTMHFNNRFILNAANKAGIFCIIDQIKVDLIHYNFKNIFPVETFDNIRILSNQDIAAMKVQAILGRGVKKDFFDIFELLKIFSLEEIIQFHKQKYPIQTLYITIHQALTFFKEAEESDNPLSLNNTTWEEVKTSLKKAVNHYLK